MSPSALSDPPARALALSERLARVPAVLVATRARRIALWAVAASALGGVAFAIGAFGLAGSPPSGALRVGLDLAGILAVALAYLLLTGRRRVTLGTSTAPLNTLGVLLALALGLLALESLFALLVDGRLDAKTRLPTTPETAVVAGLATVAEGVFLAALLAGLRSLVLYRRRRVALWMWGGFLASVLGFGLTTVAALPGEAGERFAPVVFVLSGALFALGCAFRQGWVGVLTLRQRALAAGLAVLLGGALVGLFFLREAGPAQVGIGALSQDGTVAYAAAISMPVDMMTRLALLAGVLYTLTASLVLLFQVPMAESLAQRAGERRAMRALADLSGRGLDVGSISAAVARAPVEAGLADAAWVALPNPETGSLDPVVRAAHPVSADLAGRAADARALVDAAEHAPFVVEHATADHRVRARPGDGIGSLAALKLGSGPEAGVLVVTRRSAEAFQPDDVAALETFSSQAGLALTNARLFAGALEREKLARELAVAREVQQRLLPDALPEIPGVRLAAVEKPAQTVGGDYYDALTIDDGCLGVIVADVSGKGAGAAFYMAEMKGIFQAASRLTRSPSEFLWRANGAMASSLKRGAFVSAIYGVLDSQAGTLALARAGHCPALLVRRDGATGERTTDYLRPDGLALGLDRTGLFRRTMQEEKVHLAPGDVCVLFTDGVVEARRPDGEAFGYERLAETAARLCPREGACDPAAIRDELLASVASFTGSTETDDDVTLVVVAWDGRSDRASGAPSSP